MTIKNVSQQERKAITAVINRCEKMYGVDKTRIVFNAHIKFAKESKKLMEKRKSLEMELSRLNKKKRA